MTILARMKTAIDDMRTGNVSTYLDMLSDDYRLHVNGQPTPVNREIAGVLLRALRRAVPDLDLGITNLRQVGDDRITFDTRITGTHRGTMELPGIPPSPPTDRRIQGDPQTATFWFKDGKLVREDIVTPPGSDPMSVYKQLGIERMPG
ncbi:MAG TPA: nuclear transport factor 2 family protein [Kofleriaceae bacterium]|nr:nuclear transport factor 2 family protein [Kofleriaceae bacterium]